MKYLIIAALLLTGCSNKYQLNDCVIITEKESWDRDPNFDIYKIVEIGKKQYLLEVTRKKVRIPWSIYQIDRGTKKVDCPEWLK